MPERTPQQRQAMLVFVGMHVTIFGFYLVQATTNFGDPGGTPWGLLVLVPIACQAHHSRAAARGERAAAWPVTLTLLVASVVVVTILPIPSGLGWWLVGASAAMLLPGRYSTLWFVPPLVVMLATNLPQAIEYDPAMAVWYVFYVPTVYLLGAGGLVVSARLVRELDELRSARIELAEVAVQRERLRVSRDLHDLLGHSLSAVALKGELAMRLQDADPERAAREIDDLSTIATTALADLRATTYERRDVRLATELRGAVRLLAAAGIAAHVTGCDDAGIDDLPEPVDALLGWAVREGITNVLRHSEATTCTIALDRGPATVSLVISNDTPGIPGDEPGSGLVGLAGRARELGGELDVEHTTDRFRLRLDVPLMAQDGEAS
ncbi:sensor histidine kinase [Pseudonocardia sp. CA-107938]|uniref:sensor histidine kinase n=1 Tax=Pseudonocardia sp. CA-107938 TaxID=3240021 RepID=UPI003D8D8837